MNTVFLEKFSSQAFGEASNKDKECRSRAMLVSTATGVMGFSTGFAVQVATRRYIPGFVKKYYVIPSLLAAYVSTRTHMYLVNNCKDTFFILPKRFTIQSDSEAQNDAVVLS